MTNSITTSAKPLSEQPLSRPTRVLVALVRVYQRLHTGRVAPCRFYPSCSHYALEALETHGALRGGGLALRRVLKCRPFGPHGIDLVPEAHHVRSSQS
jgi:putative membrane protein insertion efficiency factor